MLEWLLMFNIIYIIHISILGVYFSDCTGLWATNDDFASSNYIISCFSKGLLQ